VTAIFPPVLRIALGAAIIEDIVENSRPRRASVNQPWAGGRKVGEGIWLMLASLRRHPTGKLAGKKKIQPTADADDDGPAGKKSCGSTERDFTVAVFLARALGDRTPSAIEKQGGAQARCAQED